MRLNVGQLSATLQKSLSPVYVITGDEPLQLGEAADDIRQAAKQRGYLSRTVISIDSGHEWPQLAEQAQTLSLFSEQKLIDLRLPSAKPGAEGSKALLAYCNHLPEDTILVLTMGKVDSSGQKSQWFQTLERVGTLIQVWPLQSTELHQWLARRAERRGLHLTQDAIRGLSSRVEGNLLAAAQEIEKLYLRHGPVAVTGAMIEDEVSDNSRFDVFKLADAVIMGDGLRAAKILQGLRAEGIADAVVLWALSRELRVLCAIKTEMQKGIRPESLYKTYQIWDKRQSMVSGALQRIPLSRLHKLLSQCTQTDCQIKGQASGDAWESLLMICIAMTKSSQRGG